MNTLPASDSPLDECPCPSGPQVRAYSSSLCPGLAWRRPAGEARVQNVAPGDPAGLLPLVVTGPCTQASTTAPGSAFPGASRLARGTGEGGERGGWGPGRGLPTPGGLDVAQINSPPISSWANLETDQTRNSTAGGVEPGLMPTKPAAPLPASPEPQSQPEPDYCAPVTPCGSVEGEPDAPRPEGAPPPPNCCLVVGHPLALCPGEAELDPRAGTSLSP